MSKPLEGIRVLDCSQFLSAPSAGLKLADLGAEVIKIEKKGNGDICRQLYVSNFKIDNDSSLFHAINRNKQGLELDLKNEKAQEKFQALVKTADVILVNFRPGVASKLKLDVDSIHQINPKIVYGEITGYGEDSPWNSWPGQDLLIQGMSGLCYLNGDKDQAPLPFGLSMADLAAGEHLCQGVLAGIFNAQQTGKGCVIQTELLTSLMDLQFESFTTFLNNGNELPIRSGFHNANPYIDAPYGIYETKNSYLAIAMCPIEKLAELLDYQELATFMISHSVEQDSDEIKRMLQEKLITQTTEDWLTILEPADIWCTKVLNWQQMEQAGLFEELKMKQKIISSDGTPFYTTRCPIRIDGEIFTSEKGAPNLGEDNLNFGIEEAQ
ncbi:CoA transferase [Enterococcus hulanensis]|uniref:CaiB/BaiF CoA transferase family protein n=1 Tax=Enterococcus hulanensis TaxID=2559929 RepID=UPI001A8D625E|nr:CaiB/BaiF CoA-transferase family protein [Enterococcus hulanensis]MBO0455163.1 CoA transferase [Enterococcus hulanensis]